MAGAESGFLGCREDSLGHRSSGSGRAGPSELSICMPALLLLVSLVAVGVAAAAPKSPDLVAAVFPPWWDAADAIGAAAAAGDIVGPGGTAFVLIVKGGPDLPVRIRAAGGIAIDPTAAGLCFGWSRRDV